MEFERKPAEPYSRQRCLFAFEGVRVTAEQQLGIWLERLAADDGQAVLESLWGQAGEYCTLRGVDPVPFPKEITSERVSGSGYEVLWIGLPSAEFVPEPGSIGVVWPSSGAGSPDRDAAAKATAVYYAEKSLSGTGYVLTRMSEGTHAILGSLFSADRDELLEQIEARESTVEGDDAVDEQGFFGTPALDHSMAFGHYVAWTQGEDEAESSAEPDDSENDSNSAAGGSS